MISASIRNFRGVDHVELDIDPLALVGGRNAMGKSSLAQGVASALCGKGPALGRTNDPLVRTGTTGATIEVRGERGSVTMTWPAGTSTVTGEPPQASEFACGIDSLVSLARRDRGRVLSEYLHADPTREEVHAALAAKGLNQQGVTDAIWSLIEQHGWDGAESLRRERGAGLKGQWRQITSQTYGSRVAASWRPDLADLDEAELEADVRRAQAERDHAVSAQAVSDAERRRLQDEAELLIARRGAHDRATARVDEFTAAYRRAQEARGKLPPADKSMSFPCPHCGGPLMIDKVSLVETRVVKAPAINLDNKELQKRRDAIASAEGEMRHAEADLQQARRELGQAEAAVRDSVAAGERIANWPRAVEIGTDLEAASQALTRAERRLTEARMKHQADDIHGKIEGNQVVIELLAGDGLRAAKLARVLDVFVSQTLRPLTEAAGWPPIAIDTDMTITSMGRPYALLSTSEQYRVRVALQVAMAQLEGADMVIIDAAEVLDAPARNGLFGLLTQAGLPALVCLTLSKPEQLPDPAAAGAGRSYWLAGGVVEDRREDRAA